jgi:hypothetical protein
MKNSGRCTSNASIVDKSLANLYHVHSDLIKTHATLKDRAAINMAAWQGDILGAKDRCERETKSRKAAK